MRVVINILLVVIIIVFLSADNPKVKWYTMDEAVELNKKNPKKIFVDVYTDWCGWCTKMDKNTFAKPNVANYMNKHFYNVKFNAEGYEKVNFNGRLFENTDKTKRSTHPFAAALLQGKMSYPSYVFLDENNRGITVLKGYREEEYFMSFLKFIVSDSYKTMTYDEYAKK
jgi:thioredoxin-related protein